MDKNGGKIKVLVNLDRPVCGYHASESSVKPDRPDSGTVEVRPNRKLLQWTTITATIGM